MINLIQKRILVNFLRDTLHKFIYRQLFKIQRIWCQKRDFIVSISKVFHKSICTPKFNANKKGSIKIKIENIFQRLMYLFIWTFLICRITCKYFHPPLALLIGPKAFVFEKRLWWFYFSTKRTCFYNEKFLFQCWSTYFFYLCR